MMKMKFMLLLTLALTLSACRSEAQKLNDAGNEAFAAGQYDVALEQYQSASAEDPDLAVPDYNRANVYYRQTNFEDAGTALRTAMLRSDTTLTQHGQFNLGNALFNLGDYAGAAEAYKQALRLDPQDMDAKVNLELTLQLLAQQEQQDQEQDQDQEQEQEDQQDQPQEQQEQRDDPQGGQSDQNQEENSDPSDSEQEQPSGEGEQQENQDRNESQDGAQSQQPEQQPGEEADAGQGEQQEEPQDQQPGEQPTEQGQPPAPQDPQQAGSSGADQQARMLPGQGPPMQLQGLTEEQARQLLLAASQDTETLQEYLQQIYVFPFSEVENDW